MSTTFRRRVAAACVIISSVLILASIAGLLTGHASAHAVSAVAFGAISIAGGLTYLHSSKGRP